jgi:hypothetical protein
MNNRTGPCDDIIAEADRVIADVKKSRLAVRLAGGLAIRRLCPIARQGSLSRPYADLDLAIAGQTSNSLTDLMISLGYEDDAHFNKINGNTRLYYIDHAHRRHVDVFVDAVRMCHVIDFKDRLTILDETLTATDLLLSKLQIVELNRKDVLDAIALLHDQSLKAGGERCIDTAYLEQVWGNDWPLWRTSQITLTKIQKAVPELLAPEQASHTLGKVSVLMDLLDSGRKSLRWRIRARVGERIRWYEIPEEIN